MSTPSDKSLQPRTLEELLNEMQAVCDAAVEGPYWTYKGSGVFSKGHEGVNLIDETGETSEETLEFLAQSRTAMPRLIHALRFTVKHVYKYAGLTSNEEREFEAMMSKILQGRS